MLYLNYVYNSSIPVLFFTCVDYEFGYECTNLSLLSSAVRFVYSYLFRNHPFLSYLYHMVAPYTICNTPKPNAQYNKPFPKLKALIKPSTTSQIPK